MPFKTDKIAIKDPFLDRRTKMLPCQKEMAFWHWENGMSITGVARLFRVNKRLIQFLFFPERQAKNLDDRDKRGGTMAYYNREKHAENTKEHRNYKHKELNKFNGFANQ